MKTLKDAAIGETVTVKRIHGEGALKRRIMDMGITDGADAARLRAVAAQSRLRTDRSGRIVRFGEKRKFTLTNKRGLYT